MDQQTFKKKFDNFNQVTRHFLACTWDGTADENPDFLESAKELHNSYIDFMIEYCEPPLTLISYQDFSDASELSSTFLGLFRNLSGSDDCLTADKFYFDVVRAHPDGKKYGEIVDGFWADDDPFNPNKPKLEWELEYEKQLIESEPEMELVLSKMGRYGPKM